MSQFFPFSKHGGEKKLNVPFFYVHYSHNFKTFGELSVQQQTCNNNFSLYACMHCLEQEILYSSI